jgi:glycosyltransferase involved in cell wall biosynthesis
VIVMALSFAVAGWTIIASLFNIGSTRRGWSSLMAVMLLLGGVQLLCIGVLGEYLGRVYRETKGRPLYVVNEVIGPEGRDDTT